jgi:hypothetical protein
MAGKLIFDAAAKTVFHPSMRRRVFVGSAFYSCTAPGHTGKP